MKKKFITRLSCLVISFIFLLALFPLSASAASSVQSTDVMSDLRKMSDFDEKKYTKNENEDYVSLIYFHEYGYDYNERQNDYGLYLYIYNPSGKQIVSSQLNTITLKCGKSYKDYKLSIVSYSTDKGIEHLFYKFKIQTDKNFVQELSTTKRVYDIAGYSFCYMDEKDAKKFENKYLYYYTGFDSYHGVDSNSKLSTLYCYSDIEEMISVELHPGSWKTNSSDKGVNHQYEISSVYFAIPNYILEKYGSVGDLYNGLYSITAAWNEYKTNGLITNSQNLYSEAKAYEGYVDSDLNIYDKAVPFMFHVVHQYTLNVPCDRCSFNYNRILWFDKCPMYVGNSKVGAIPKLNNVIYVNYDDFVGLSSASTKDLLKNDSGSYNTFSFVDDGRIYGFNKHTFTVDDGSLNSQIKTFAQTHNNFWTWLSGYGELNKDEGVSDTLNVFHKVSSSDFIDDTVTSANKLFLSYEDYISLRTFYRSVNKKEYTVYILRYAVTDYVIAEANVDRSGVLLADQDYYGKENYYFEKTIFLDFNFLDMSFNSEEGSMVTLPVESGPIDIIGSVTEKPNINDDSNNFFDKLFSGSYVKDEDPGALIVSLLSITLVLFVIVIGFIAFAKIYRFFGKGKRKDSSGGVTIVVNSSSGSYENKSKRRSKKEKNSNSNQIITTGDPVTDADLNAKYAKNVINDRSYGGKK